jgi:hypothetical protein
MNQVVTLFQHHQIEFRSMIKEFGSPNPGPIRGGLLGFNDYRVRSGALKFVSNKAMIVGLLIEHIRRNRNSQHSN